LEVKEVAVGERETRTRFIVCRHLERRAATTTVAARSSARRRNYLARRPDTGSTGPRRGRSTSIASSSSKLRTTS
jgi:hypothetical protein